jgi:type II secretory pathway component GspD/PulD (secretin)
MINKLFFLALFLFSIEGSADETVMEIIPLSNRPASEIYPIVAPLLDTSDSLIPNGFNLIVKTTPTKLRELKTVIKKLDNALTNLTITVVQTQDFNAEQLNAGLGIDINLVVNNPSQSQGNVEGHYQQQYRQNNIENQQVLMTLEGTAAHIKVGRHHPIKRTQVYYSIFGERIVSQQTQLIEASTGFVVLPRLNGEQVILEISPWSDTLQGNSNINTQEVTTTLRTHLGEWVEIGAVNQQYNSEATKNLSYQQGSYTKRLRILVKVEK